MGHYKKLTIKKAYAEVLEDAKEPCFTCGGEGYGTCGQTGMPIECPDCFGYGWVYKEEENVDGA